MNVVDLIEAARPDPAPMPLDQRRMVRERLFGAADDAAATSIRERSGSGAVTSTAPPGYRARRVAARPSRPRSTGSLARMGVGLLVVGVAAAAAWSWWSDSDTDDESPLVAETAASTTAPPTTEAPATTTTVATRTGVTATEPLLTPLELIPVEEAVIDLAPLTDEAALLRAADGTWLRLDAVEGGVAENGGLDFVPVGSLDVAPFAFGPDQPWIYIVRSTCGAVRMVDAPEQEQFRPVVTELLAGMSIDAGGSVDALLPGGMRVVAAGPGEREYRTVFRLEPADGGEAELLTLRQVPDGSIAQMIGGGVQPSEMVWLGEPALGTGDLDPNDESTGPVEVVWLDADTAFAVSSDTVPLDRLESFVSELRAVSVTDWGDRFAAAEVDSSPTLGGAPDEESATTDPPCSPQPSLGPTFRP